MIFKYVVYPLQNKFTTEKRALELKNARLMALFAELDPNPVIRINNQGKIIFMNSSASGLIKSEKLEGKTITQIIPAINFPVNYYITNNKAKEITYTINSKSYSILFKGISSLKIAQLYFHDITEKIEYQNKLKNLSGTLQNKIEENKLRIARELHDGIGQNLLFLKMDLLKNYRQLTNKNSDARELKDSIEYLQKTILELKIILYDLKPPALEELGLTVAVSSLVNKISAEGILKGSLNVFGLEKRLNLNLEIALFRIIQEALNNIVKHSGAKEFSIQIVKKNNVLRMLIFDDGVGFNINKTNSNGYGLLNIKERAENFNGKFKVDSSNNGTLLIIEIPMENTENA